MRRDDLPTPDDLEQELAIQQTGIDRNQAGEARPLRAHGEFVDKPPQPEKVPPPPKPPKPEPPPNK